MILHLDSWLPVLLGVVVRPVAVTLGQHIFVRRGVSPTDQLLRHETVHACQFAELGLLVFLWFYLTDFSRALWSLRDRRLAYLAIRLEREARALEGLDVPWREVGALRTPGGWR